MFLTAGDLRRMLLHADNDAVVHICVDDFTYAPVVDFKIDAQPGEIGVVLLMPDPTSELVKFCESAGYSHE